MKNLRIITLSVAFSLWSLMSYAQFGEDCTSKLADPGMAALASWTNNGFKINTKGASYEQFSGSFIEQWTASSSTSLAALSDLSIEQTLTDLPNGSYLFSAACIACQQGNEEEVVTGVYLYANADEQPVATGNGVPQRFYALANVTDGTLTVGLKTVSTGANWVAWDNAELYYYGEGVNVNKDLTVALWGLKGTLAKSEAYADTLKMQLSVLAALQTAEANATTALANATTVEEVTAVQTALQTAMTNAGQSIEAYTALWNGMESATAVYNQFAAVESVVDELAKLSTTIDSATAIYTEATSDTTAVFAAIHQMEEAAAAVRVGEQVYVYLDSLNYIFSNCEFGTSYGMYPLNQYEKLSEMESQLDDYLTQYQDGKLTASEVLPYILQVEAAIAKFWTTMVTIDFTQKLNVKLFPYDPEVAEEVAAHDELFMGDNQSPFAIGCHDVAGDSLMVWNIDNNFCNTSGAKTADILSWYMSTETAYAWLYMQHDGVFHPLLTHIPAVIYTAPEDAIYIVQASISSQDANRVSKNRGDMQCYAYYIADGTSTLSQIGEAVTYNNNTDPAKMNFYVNLKAGDKVAVVGGDCRASGSNGNALSKVDTLYVLGAKDEEHGYTVADAQKSGLVFFNPYTTAENWDALAEAIDLAESTLNDNADKKGDGYSLYPESAFNLLDSITKEGVKVLETQVASQPEVDQNAAKINSAVAAFLASTGYALAIGTETIPSDTAVDFTSAQYLPDGLYYILDEASQNYITAPSGNSDKATMPLSALLDETKQLQNAQVWHFNYNDSNYVYAVSSHQNDGSLWTLEEEQAAGTDNSSFNGYFHLAENAQARFGTSWYVVTNETDVLWRTFRVLTNGTNYCLLGGSGEIWNSVILANSGVSVSRSAGGAYNFCWKLIPFGTGSGVESLTTDASVVERSYFNLLGMKQNRLEQGLNVIRERHSDGTVTVRKVWIRE